MSCPKCAELEQQVSYLQNEVEYWNSLYKRERDKNLAGTFEELSGLSAKNKSLTESVAEYKKLYYDTRTRAEAIRASLTERARQDTLQMRKLVDACEYVVNRQDYTFAECSEAEEIVRRCRDALAPTRQVCMEHGYIREGRDCKKCESATQDKPGSWQEKCPGCGWRAGHGIGCKESSNGVQDE